MLSLKHFLQIGLQNLEFNHAKFLLWSQKLIHILFQVLVKVGLCPTLLSHCLTPDDFTRQDDNAGAQSVKTYLRSFGKLFNTIHDLKDFYQNPF
jgi:hypothetical protein